MTCDQILLDGDNKMEGGLTVEVDESLFGKRKYQKGSCKGRGKWISGGVCRETKINLYDSVRQKQKGQKNN